MNEPWLAYKNISREQWSEVRSSMIFEHHKWDPRIGDIEVLADFAIIIHEQAWRELASIAEKLSAEIFAAEGELRCRPEFFKQLGLSWKLRWALRGAAKKPVIGAARQIRFDFHWTTGGWMISEANTDVPGGYSEAGALSRLMQQYYSNAEVIGEPAKLLCEKFSAAIDKNTSVGLVHASAYTDDRQVMMYIAKELQKLQIRAELLSPDQIE
ncbi:MAG: hypothetical protein ABFD79_11940 [Phycisphaerales bacterium]